jgi:thiamine pyrophosphokinase
MYQDVPPKSYQAYVFSPRFASHLLCVNQYFWNCLSFRETICNCGFDIEKSEYLWAGFVSPGCQDHRRITWPGHHRSSQVCDFHKRLCTWPGQEPCNCQIIFSAISAFVFYDNVLVNSCFELWASSLYCCLPSDERGLHWMNWQIKLLVLGGLGGRFDHEAANINVLYTFANVLHIVLLSEESSLTLLPSGYLHEIHVNRSFEGPHCGLVPLGAPSTSTTTTGLHWNLGTYKSALVLVWYSVESLKQTMEFGLHAKWWVGVALDELTEKVTW